MDWKTEAKRLKFDQGKSWTELTSELAHYFPGSQPYQIRERIRNYIRALPEYREKHNQPIKPKEPERKIEVVQNLEPTVLHNNWRGNRVIKFGLMGDPQICSKYTQLTFLHDYYDWCAENGVKTVYNTGDLTDGDQMRMGHQYELYKHGADDQTEEVINVYPEREGITTEFILGNHDASIMKRSGHDIGPVISYHRKDMKYLGRDCAIVYLTPNCTLELRHPWDGTAYAISYKTQKMVEAMAGGEKPNILAVGHYHKSEYIFYRNVHTFQTGCFQAQTPFLRGKSISIMMGGWIVEAEVDKEGHIREIMQKFRPYYKGIPNDYKSWQFEGARYGKS